MREPLHTYLKERSTANTRRWIMERYGLDINESTLRDWAKRQKLHAITYRGKLIDIVDPERSVIKARMARAAGVPVDQYYWDPLDFK